MSAKRTTKFNPRQYMLSRDYEIYYYSDTHFQSVGLHSHDYFEFYFFESGDGCMEIKGEAMPLRSGDVVVVPPGVSHRALLNDGDAPYRRFVFWITKPFCAELAKSYPELALLTERAERDGRISCHLDLLDFSAVRSDLFSLLDEIQTERFGKSSQIRLAISGLLLRLCRAFFGAEGCDERSEASSRREAVVGFIDTHLDEDLSLERIAKELYLSKFYVSHLFREATGLTVHQYVTKKRLAKSLLAIKSGAPIGQVWAACGFQDHSSFYRAFKKEYGLSPSRYRELNRR